MSMFYDSYVYHVYFCGSCTKFFSHFCCLFLRTSFKGGLKKEEFEHSKHDKEFYQDDNPQCFSPSHPSEPLGINAEKGFKCS